MMEFLVNLAILAVLLIPVEGMRPVGEQSHIQSRSRSTNFEELKAVFNYFDKNDDNLISNAELLEGFKPPGIFSTQAKMSRMMDEVDVDRDGFLNLTEFVHICQSPNIDMPGCSSEDGVLRDAFDMYDKNGDGHISISELHDMLHGLGGEPTTHDCHKMVEAMDLDGDWSVNFEEFKRIMSEL